jgi:Uma2 family endonuclease
MGLEEPIMATGTLRPGSKMKPRLSLGHRDHGRDLTYDQYLAADYEKGYLYELILGRLYVSPAPNYPQDWMRQYVDRLLTKYQEKREDVVPRISAGARVFVPRMPWTTCPEPDFAIYDSCPPGRKVDWREISPLIVVEIVSENSFKDYVRNVELYQRVPSIREYWVIDGCEDEENGPILRVYHRRTARQKWQIAEYGPRDTYTTDLLPGFKLPVCPPK